jgi:hypothetical protein
MTEPNALNALEVNVGKGLSAFNGSSGYISRPWINGHFAARTFIATHNFSSKSA